MLTEYAQNDIDLMNDPQLTNQVNFYVRRSMSQGPRLNIKTVFPRYADSHVKYKTVGETVLSLTWGSLYW